MPSSRSTARPCAANASFSSITSICRQGEAGALQHLLRRRRRADAHDARRDAGRRHADDARARRQAVPCRRAPRLAMISAQAPSLTPEALPAVTVPSCAHDGLELGERLQRGRRADARPWRQTTGSPFFCGIVTGTISLVEEAGLLRRPPPSAASASAIASCVLARDLVIARHVLGRSRASSRRRTAPSSAG